MTKTKKLMTAALAVAALATASIASVGDAQARGGHGGGFRGGFHGGAKFFGGGRHFGHRWHGHRRFYGYGFAYNTCWKYTPYGLVNVCKVLRTKHPGRSATTRPGEWLGRVFIWLRLRGVLPPPMRYPVAPHSRGEPGPWQSRARSRQSADRAAAGVVGGAVCGRAAASPQGRPDAVHRRRSGRRLLSGRAGPAQGQRGVALGRRAHPGDPRPRRAGRRVRDDRRAAAFGLGDGGARFRIELHQPRLVRAGRRRRIPDVYRHIVKLLVRRLRDTNNVVAATSFLLAQGPRRAGAAQPRRGVRQRRRRRAAS